MSIHGMQLRLPYGIDGENNSELNLSASLALDFKILRDKIDIDEKELVNFSLIMWPFITIQSEPNEHVVVDEVGICFYEDVLTSPPLTAQVGHVLRSPEMEPIEKLQVIKDILLHYKTVEEENEEEEIPRTAFFERKIEGLVEPGLLKEIFRYFGMRREFNVSEEMSLESYYSFDDALSFTEKYVKTIEESKGIGIRWSSLRSIIRDPVEKWKTDIEVEIKEIKERYDALIEKEKTLDETTIESELDSAKMDLDQWIIRQQKKIIEKIGRMFVAIDLIMQDIREKNSFFLNTDRLKTFPIDEVVKRAYQHIAFIRDSLGRSDEKLKELSARMNTIREDLENTELTAEERIKKLNKELLDKKLTQEQKIHQLENERNHEINQLQEKLDTLVGLYNEIMEIIDNKVKDSENDVKKLREWQINDRKTGIAKPTERFYLPIGIALLVDEDEEEYLEICFPRVLKKNMEIKVPSVVLEFERKVAKLLDRDMRIRSNFEFTLEKYNIRDNSHLYEKIIEGLEWLRKHFGLKEEEFTELKQQIEKIRNNA